MKHLLLALLILQSTSAWATRAEECSDVRKIAAFITACIDGDARVERMDAACIQASLVIAALDGSAIATSHLFLNRFFQRVSTAHFHGGQTVYSATTGTTLPNARAFLAQALREGIVEPIRGIATSTLDDAARVNPNLPRDLRALADEADRIATRAAAGRVADTRAMQDTMRRFAALTVEARQYRPGSAMHTIGETLARSSILGRQGSYIIPASAHSANIRTLEAAQRLARNRSLFITVGATTVATFALLKGGVMLREQIPESEERSFEYPRRSRDSETTCQENEQLVADSRAVLDSPGPR